MNWLKLGNIFDPRGKDWIASHAQVPTAFQMGDCIRVFYAARDETGKSYTLYIDVSASDPTQVISEPETPALTKGKPGTFDDDGVMPGYVIRRGDDIFMYYTGWNAKKTTPYHNSTGLAVSSDGATFTRVYEGPVMDRSPTEPYLAVTPTILFENGLWRAWYSSGLKWVKMAGKFEPVYVIKYARSEDGINWTRPPEICIPQKHDLEASNHPTVIKISGLYHMWYCYRHSRDYRGGEGSYRIGYATSEDGVEWERTDDEAGITVSPEGWDSEMVCYPFVVEVGGNKYMFYNGNGFGKTGIGVAILQE
jgi:sucrose-6-phosphate hydrolase SacC (GH32 family)